jgi:transposase
VTNASPAGAVIGVDTHKRAHAAAVLSVTGAVLDRVTVAADPAGYRRLAALGGGYGRCLWAIEGSGACGAGLTTLLLAPGQTEVEVDRPARPPRRAGVKTDEVDAVRGARQALAGEGISKPRCRGHREAIRVLLITRAQVIGFRTQAIASLHALVTTAPDGIRERLRHLSCGALVRACAALRGSGRPSAEEFATTMALRATARRITAFDAEARQLETQLRGLVAQLAPSLLQATGVGPVVAGQAIVSWSHRGRVRSEAAFAKLAGAAPIQASSGSIVRHRLCHSGDRQLNRALHTIALTRIRQDPATRAYVARHTAEGKTLREIKRCLKRYIARQLYRELERTAAGLDRTYKRPTSGMAGSSQRRNTGGSQDASTVARSSAGGRSPRTRRGRLLSSVSTASRCCGEWALRSVPLGK